MKNNTKIRLHLSKQLFESLAKEVLAEAKKMDMSGGAYTEAVKMPKEKKEPKAEGIHDHPSTGRITDNPQTNVKSTGADYDPKARAASLAKLANFGPKGDKDKDKDKEIKKESMDPNTVTDILTILAGVGGLTLSGAAIAKWQERIKAKNPELYSKLGNLRGSIEKMKRLAPSGKSTVNEGKGKKKK